MSQQLPRGLLGFGLVALAAAVVFGVPGCTQHPQNDAAAPKDATQVDKESALVDNSKAASAVDQGAAADRSTGTGEGAVAVVDRNSNTHPSLDGLAFVPAMALPAPAPSRHVRMMFQTEEAFQAERQKMLEAARAQEIQLAEALRARLSDVTSVEWTARPDPAETPEISLNPKLGVLADKVPVLAALGGPFALVEEGDVTEPPSTPNAAKKKPRAKSKPGTAGVGEPQAGRQPTPGSRGPMGSFPKSVAVIDLRTGRKAGTFPYLTYQLGAERLSPDGSRIVTPQTAVPGEAWNAGRQLFAWAGKNAQPVASLAPESAASWIEFIDNDRVAFLSVTPKPALHIWNTNEGDQVKTIDLPAKSYKNNNLISNMRPGLATYPGPRTEIGAISPGGQFVALGGATGILLVDLKEARLAGELALPSNGSLDPFKCYSGVTFTSDGSHVVAIVQDALYAWSLEDGKLVTSAAPVTPLPGAAFLAPGPTPSTVDYVAPVGPGSASTLIEVFSGVEVATRKYAVLRRAGPKRVLGYGPLSFAPHMPLPKKVSDELMIVKSTPKKVAQEKIAQARESRDRRALFAIDDDPSTELRAEEKKIEARTESNRAELAARQEAVDKTVDSSRQERAVAEAMLAPRADASLGDRVGLKQIVPVPTGWNPPPEAQRPQAQPIAGDAEFSSWPIAFSDVEAAIVVNAFNPKPVARFEQIWRRLDPKTGKPEGAPTTLWPSGRLAPGDPPNSRPPLPTLGALSADGQQLAVRDPLETDRVDVWKTGGDRIAGLRPYGAGKYIDWIGFSASGKLLTLGSGTLTAWELPLLKAVYEVAGDYRDVARLAPGRGWVAVASGNSRVDLLDTETGTCLGRIEDRLADCRTVTISPDGRTLALVRVLGTAPPKVQQPVSPPSAPPDPQYPLQLVTYNVADGQAGIPVLCGVRLVKGLHWAGRRLVIVSDTIDLIDVDNEVRIMSLGITGENGAEYVTAYDKVGRPLDPFQDDPYGRLWGGTANRNYESNFTGWGPVTFKPNTKDEAASHVDLEKPLVIPFRHGTTVRVEVALGARERSEKAAAAMAQQLQLDRVTLNPGGWTMRFEYETFDSGERFAVILKMFGKTESVQGAGDAIPAVRGIYKLLDPERNTVWTSEPFERRFDKQRTRYLASREDQIGSKGREVVYEYRFGGKPPRDAIIDELLDNIADAPGFATQYPRAVLKTDNRYITLPVRGIAEIPKRISGTP